MIRLRALNVLPAAILACALAFATAQCSDDDGGNGGPCVGGFELSPSGLTCIDTRYADTVRTQCGDIWEDCDDTATYTPNLACVGQPDTPPPNPGAVDDPPSDDDRNPNNVIQSDYPAIAAKARQVAPDEEDPWLVAVALERSVRDVITRSGYSQAFATAAEVIDTGEGDCTEHAVLLAALARARGIPARLAIGLVYIDQAFYYHMWTEVHVDGRWIPVDARRAEGGIGAGHLKMAHSNFKNASALTAFLPVMQVMGKLKIEVLEVE